MSENGRLLGMNAQPARVGRRPSTTRDEITAVAMTLFAQHGFDEVSVDDIAAAAGIARRTVFRYYSSKNAIVWGDFDSHLGVMRTLLERPRTRWTPVPHCVKPC